MLKPDWRILIIPLASSLIAGCMGVAVLATSECKSSVPICDYTYSKGEWGPKERAKANDPPEANFLLSKDEFIARWGKPNETVVFSDDEVTLVYRDPDVWCGAVPVWVFIPAPAIAPTCEVFDRITFKGNRATYLHFKREDRAAAWVLPMPMGQLMKPCPKACPPQLEVPNQ